MKGTSLQGQLWLANILAFALWACGSSAGGDSGSGGQNNSGPETSSSTSSNTSTAAASTTGSATGTIGTTGPSTNGAPTTTSTTSTSSSVGGASATSMGGGGATTTATNTSAGGAVSDAAVSTNTTSAAGGGCTVGPWPAADPAMPGSFTVVTEENVGPLAGEGEDGEPVAFTMFRPEELGQEGGLCHPVVTWGNGTGSSPSLYGVLLRHLASQGFVVIASDSPNVANGDPPPMVAGVTWVLEQNADPTSALYQHIDVTHVGGTGHSQGGFATTQAGGDDQITTIAPFCGATTQRNLHGPAMLLCGGMDDVVPCTTIQNAFDGINNQPVMLAEYLSADHANWVTFRGTDISPMETAMVAWMRVHLMGDTSLRSWFYGASCGLCGDSAWQISQKMMDE